MITGALAVVFIMAAIVSANNGEWGSFWVGIAVVVLLLLFGMASRDCDRAYNNFVGYWARGGPKRKRK